VPTAMHELAAGQDTPKSWPVGITGFGLGVIDHPGTGALVPAAAPAAGPSSTTAAPKATAALLRADHAIDLMRSSRMAGRYALVACGLPPAAQAAPTTTRYAVTSELKRQQPRTGVPEAAVLRGSATANQPSSGRAESAFGSLYNEMTQRIRRSSRPSSP